MIFEQYLPTSIFLPPNREKILARFEDFQAHANVSAFFSLSASSPKASPEGRTNEFSPSSRNSSAIPQFF